MSEIEKLEHDEAPFCLEDDEGWKRSTAVEHLSGLGIVQTAAERAEEWSDVRMKSMTDDADQMEYTGQ